MLRESNPVAAVFIGGMEGIFQEYELFRQVFPARPTIPIGGPGGASRQLVDQAGGLPDNLRNQLLSQRYPSLFRSVMAFLSRSF
jgi:hypothetical protein